MTFTRVRRTKTDNYAIICTRILKDKSISLKARGLFLTVMSLPDEWDFSVKGFTSIVSDGRHAVYSALKELTEAGYVKCSRIREGQRIVGTEYTFNEVPCREAPFSLDAGSLDLGFQDLENQHQLNKEKNVIKKEEKKRRRLDIDQLKLLPPFKTFYEFFPGQKLNSYQIKLIQQITDLKRWEDTCKVWAGKAYRASNIVGLLETYERVIKGGTLTGRLPVQVPLTLKVIEDGCPFCTASPPQPCPRHGLPSQKREDLRIAAGAFRSDAGSALPV